VSTPADESPRLSLRHPGQAIRLVLTDQRFRFVLVGGINTVLSMALFIALDAWLGTRVPSIVPLVTAWTVSVLCVFFVQRAFVFRVSGHLWRDLFRFVSVNAGALGANVVLLFLASDVFRAPRVPAQLAITVVTVVFSYLAHKHFTFARKTEQPPVASPTDDGANT
jgi:putative flippase GtrA